MWDIRELLREHHLPSGHMLASIWKQVVVDGVG
jgi:hypothetical protein